MAEVSSRLFALMDVLRGQQRLNTPELARRLGVSERSIRRDLERLQSLDVSLEITTGRTGGVRLTNGALLPTLHFSDDEIVALALDLRWLGRNQQPLARAAHSAQRRLESVMGPRSAERVEALHAALFTPAEPAIPALPATVALELSAAIRARRCLEIDYESPQRRTTRTINPYGIVSVLNHWYTVGYCHLRQGVRVFRVDRLKPRRLLEEHFTPPSDFDALALVSQSLALAPFPGAITCSARLETTLERAAGVVSPAVATLEPLGEAVLMTTRCRPDQLELIAWHLLGMECEISQLEPPALREALLKLAARAQRLSQLAAA